MDYEKKYKEALERAKGLIDFCSDSELKTLENVFPELRESEDEKIRKELLAVINDLVLPDEQQSRFIAWLEKQVSINEEAEKEKNDYVSGQFLYCKGSFNEFKEGESYWLEYIGNDTYIGRSDNILNQKFHITPRQLYTWLDPRHPEKQSEQKSDNKVEPKFRIGDVIEVKPMKCHGKIFTGKPNKIVDITEKSYILDDGKAYNIELQDGWKLSEQKSAWSEEGKGNVDIIVSRLEVDIEYWKSRSKRRVDEDKRAINWLKSLKERYTWLPSDKQMQTLKYACGGNYVNLGILESLYNDLKKLKEE